MTVKHIFFLLLISFLLFLNIPAYAGIDPIQDPDVFQLVRNGNQCAHDGDWEQAAFLWEKALHCLDTRKDNQPDNQTDSQKAFEIRMDTTVYLANAYQTLGYHQRAITVLQAALPMVENSTDYYRNALLLGTLGDIYLALGEMDASAEYLLKGLEQARLSEEPRALIMILNNLANGLAADENYTGAMAFYQEALGLIEKSDKDLELKPKILLNLLRLGIEIGSHGEMAKTLNSVYEQIAIQPNSSKKASELITLSRLIREIQIKTGVTDDLLCKLVFNALTEAKQIGREKQNFRVTSYAYGYLGQLYEAKKQYADAMKLTRSAMFYAQQGNFPEVLYLWQWQLGRLFHAQGDVEAAIKVYKDAIATLSPIRQELFKGFRATRDIFNETVKPVYLGLTELLLEQAETASDENQRESYLIKARDTMEILKTAELEDFFADECLSASRTSETELKRTPPHTAVLYPITLPERLVLLLTLPNGVKQISVPVDSKQLRYTVTQYRMRLQTRPNNRFLYEGQQLYEWVIHPLETLLSEQKIDTLLIAPDGVLRLIPFSTLYDGEQFLIEKYAIGTIPAISLTDPKPGRKKSSDILLAGLSESRMGFPALPGVVSELEKIQKVTDAKVVLANKDYTVDNLTDEIKNHNYGMLHIATHGIFGGTPQESFLLTYNDKLTMDKLEQLIGLSRFREQKVELLTLSACQTALGNERAAMGLAGVAVKAGVKSAIATLWYVDDEATSLAVKEFYQQLKTPGISKVKAMQNVQKKMISQRRYWHPLYWGPFLVIGNWL